MVDEKARKRLIVGHLRAFCFTCGRLESNQHTFRYKNLNLARLPIPPRPRGGTEGILIARGTESS